MSNKKVFFLLVLASVLNFAAGFATGVKISHESVPVAASYPPQCPQGYTCVQDGPP